LLSLKVMKKYKKKEVNFDKSLWVVDKIHDLENASQNIIRTHSSGTEKQFFDSYVNQTFWWLYSKQIAL
jgi:hypothetical protein